MSNENPIASLKLSSGEVLDDSNYADRARKCIAGDTEQLRYRRLSTSKLRGIYSLIMNIYAKINSRDDFAEHKNELQHLKVKMAYECGRDHNVKEFIEDTSLMRIVGDIRTYEQFILYCRYAEGLVAYFKFYGGKD